jgi:hypothetical protein
MDVFHATRRLIIPLIGICLASAADASPHSQAAEEQQIAERLQASLENQPQCSDLQARGWFAGTVAVSAGSIAAAMGGLSIPTSDKAELALQLTSIAFAAVAAGAGYLSARYADAYGSECTQGPDA